MSLVEALAESWADTDGKLDEFRTGRAGLSQRGVEHVYSGYMAEAREVVMRLQRCGFVIEVGSTT